MFHWLWSQKGRNVIITPRIFKVGGLNNRSVMLEEGTHRLFEFEHLAFLYALGLRNVILSLEGSSWPPFMCQLELWEKVQPLLIESSRLRPYYAQKTTLHRHDSVVRSVAYTRGQKECLTFTANVSYSPETHTSSTFSFRGLASDAHGLANLLSARTFGKPSLLGPAAHAVSLLPRWRKQSKRIVWGPVFGGPSADVCCELAAHKLLDAALLAFAAPPRAYLAGEFALTRSSHALDVHMAQTLYYKSYESTEVAQEKLSPPYKVPASA